MKKHKKTTRYRLQNQARTRFAGMFEKFEERLPLTGSYTNSLISDTQAEFFITGTRELSEVGGRIDRSSEFAEQLGPFKNIDGTPMTAGLLGSFGRTLREELENPIRDYFSNTPAGQRTTDSLVAHLGTFGTFVSIEGGLLDGSIDEIVFDVHIQRTFDADLLDLEFDHDQLPGSFKSKSQLETNLRATVDFQFLFGITLSQITGGLFTVPSDAWIEVQVTDIKNAIYETTTNVSDLWNFQDLTFESLANSFSDAILGTEDWDNGGDEALVPLDISLDQTWQLEQDRIAQAIQESLKDAELSPGQNRRIVQIGRAHV